MDNFFYLSPLVNRVMSQRYHYEVMRTKSWSLTNLKHLHK